jgi:hypothetical protein
MEQSARVLEPHGGSGRFCWFAGAELESHVGKFSDACPTAALQSIPSTHPAIHPGSTTADRQKVDRDPVPVSDELIRGTVAGFQRLRRNADSFGTAASLQRPRMTAFVSNADGEQGGFYETSTHGLDTTAAADENAFRVVCAMCRPQRLCDVYTV